MREKVDFYENEAKEWRWRVVAGNEKIIGASSEGYKRRVNAENNFNSLLLYCREVDIKIASSSEERSEDARHPLEFYKDKAGDWRWRVQAQNSRLVHASTEGYKNHSDAVDNLKQLVAVVRGSKDHSKKKS